MESTGPPGPGAGTLDPDERSIVDVVARWVDEHVVGRIGDLERADRFPADLISQMRSLGIYGLRAPPELGGAPVSARCFALVSEELARGWMSLAGAMGGHSVICELLVRFGTPEQQTRWLPRLATGEVRAAMALTEPSGGSDLRSMRTTATPAGDGGYLLHGTKTWITNAQRAGLLGVLARIESARRSDEPDFAVLLVEPGDGVEISDGLGKLGYRGVESCEVHFTGCRLEPDAVLGGAPGSGFAQMMSGLELGRLQVAARATGVSRAAFDAALAYAQERETFGRPIWQHQAIGHYLADMATRLQAARTLLLHAADVYDGGARADLHVGMAKLFASEACMEITATSMRIHGGNGYSTDYEVERYYRDAPLMVIGEGTNEIQRTVIARRLVEQGLTG